MLAEKHSRGYPPWMIENERIFNEMSIRNPSFFFLSQFLACRPNREGNQGKVEVRSQNAVKYNGLRASRLKRVTFDILMVLLVRRLVADYSPGGVIPPRWRLYIFIYFILYMHLYTYIYI